MRQFISKRSIRWALVFAGKILVFLIVLDVGFLPILWISRIPFTAYFSITLFEAFCLIFIGGLYLLTSLFSTLEGYSYRYIGHGFFRRDMVSRELKGEEKRRMRQKGIIMIAIGFLLWIAAFSITKFAYVF